MKKYFVLGFILLVSCSKDNLPAFNKLENLRILALKANTPEVNPGATVTITPIISDLSATSLTFSASGCVDPGIAYGAIPTCEGQITKQVLATNAVVTAPGVGDNWTGEADTFNVTVPVDAVMFAGRTAHEIYNGVNYLVEYVLTNNSGQTVKAFKRIVVSDSAKTSKNANPVTTQVLADGVAMNSLPLSTTLNLSTDLSLTSAESYIVKDQALQTYAQTENLATTWFVTDGETKYFRSVGIDANSFKTPSAIPPGRSFYLLAITHDDRGGVSLVRKKF